ncbi:TetR/AcrR family transcriptional regulator [Taibaiella soli]|uniref:TetR/AcrR family transcriptional regulator n=1 Tax=Taibaiella soli TaxID=1649169 RepID=A0A2W2BFA7_9BACT|nr:TetR/AcrR family transcriptional regulator [Taibaiella soli]PZF74899.1 TetR/AcrR family transcriptional regulator [Taibaiella soli]
MTRKQKIAETAQRLFAERGYEHASTQLIARESEVSEALIFKHFGNKEQLLDYIIKSGYKRIVEHNRGMLADKDPLSLIYKVIDLPHKLVTDEPLFWRLQSKLTDMPFAQKQYERFIQPVNTLLFEAFSSLRYENPQKETAFLLLIVDAIWKKLATSNTQGIPEMLAFIKEKYRATG